MSIRGKSEMMARPDFGEAARIQRLREIGILDTPPDDAFGALARQALTIAPGASIAGIGFIDVDRQWFKAIVGVDVTETPRDVSFCTHTIQSPTGLMVVEDAERDRRFANNIFVTSAPYVRSYAGVRLIDGVGTLCVIGRQRRKFSDSEVMKLRILAKYVDIQLLAHSVFRNAEAARETRKEG